MPESSATSKLGIFVCNFCRYDNHKHCPGALERTSVVLHESPSGRKYKKRVTKVVNCWCCGKHPRCRKCGYDAADGIDEDNWLCRNPLECDHRVQIRLQNSPLFQQLQACRASGAAERRRVRLMKEALAARVPIEVDSFDEITEEDMRALEAELKQKRKPVVRGPGRPTTGTCECCGETTRGGRFLPGHDARYKAKLKRAWKDGDADAHKELQTRGWVK